MGGLTALFAALAVAAADILPLTHGIYVREPVSCRGASNADTLSYWGGDGGLNSQQMVCQSVRDDHVGQTYRLEVNCRNVRGPGAMRDVQTLRIVNRTTFLLYGDDRSSARYRYCGPRVPLGR